MGEGRRESALQKRNGTSSVKNILALITLLLFTPLLKLNSAEPVSFNTKLYGQLIFEDRFERNESQEIKDEPGNNWTTSSDKTANGHKQVDLNDGVMHIRTHESANHAASVRHEFAFRDGTIGIRFKLDNEGDSIKLNIADLQYKPVHAGHIYSATISLTKVSFDDLKTGVMDKKIRDARKKGTVSAKIQTMLKTKTKSKSNRIAKGKWHTALLHNDGDQLKLEINGKEVLTFRSEGFAHPTKRLLRLLPPKSVVIDDVQIWRRK